MIKKPQLKINTKKIKIYFRKCYNCKKKIYGGLIFMGRDMAFCSNNCRNKIKLGVDGGVNLETIDKVYSTGIDITIVGSALYGAKNVKNRFLELMSDK